MKYLLILLLSILPIFFYGQTRDKQNSNNNAEGEITGYIFEKDSKKPIEFANIVIYNSNDDSIISGGITDRNGYFKIDKLNYGKYYMEIIFIGYGKQKISDIIITPNKKNISLNKIFLSINAEMLGEINIEAQVNEVEYKLDKKVINVNQDVVAAGATAVEALENVPSVTTDIDGNVSLRGTESFLVLIDGRPSPLQGSEALQQIPASSIENIEIITNPSAKYEADGIGGIINIILKKERRRGYNGQVSANYGSFNSLGGNALFNYRTNKFNFFIGGEYNARKGKGTGESRRETYIKDTTFYLFDNSKNNRNGGSGNIRLGFDYYIKDNEIITVSGKYGNYKRDRGSDTWVSSFYNNPLQSRYNEYYYFSEKLFNLGGGYFSGDINYMKKFQKEKHELQAYVSFSRDFDEEINQYTEQQTNEYWNPIYDYFDTYRTKTNYIGNVSNAKIDYTLPLLKQAKLELGWQMKYSMQNNKYKYQTLLGNNWIDDSQKINPYKFSNDIQSGYAIFSNYFKKLGYQVGFRTEYTNRLFNQTTTNQKWSYKKFDFFPSLHFSYQLPADMQVMASYSRRLERPKSYFLDPFIEIIDPNNIRQGNPNLEPEYTNSYDMSLQKKFGTHFISVEAYAKQTNNKIERIINVDENNPNINISSHDNIGQDFSLGTEVMANLNIYKWWNLNLSGNVFYYEIISDKYASNNTVTWRTRLNNTFRIKKSGTVIQFGGNYSGPSITSQGKHYGSFMANIGVKQDFLDRKLSVSLNLRDVFATGKWKNETITDKFYSFSEHKRKSPTFNISITYKINDFKVRKDRNSEDDSRGDDEGGM